MKVSELNQRGNSRAVEICVTFTVIIPPTLWSFARQNICEWVFQQLGEISHSKSPRELHRAQHNKQTITLDADNWNRNRNEALSAVLKQKQRRTLSRLRAEPKYVRRWCWALMEFNLPRIKRFVRIFSKWENISAMNDFDSHVGRFLFYCSRQLIFYWEIKARRICSYRQSSVGITTEWSGEGRICCRVRVSHRILSVSSPALRSMEDSRK